MASETSLIFRMIGVDRVTPAALSASRSMNTVGTAVIAMAGVVAFKSAKLATDWEAMMTRVVTGAGEMRSEIEADSKGLLKMMGTLGLSAKDITRAFYDINSAGIHGAAALKVMEVAGKGARTGGAELLAVTDALTTMLNAYGLSGESAARSMNVLIGAEIKGKGTLEQLAKAIPTVATVAARAGVSMEEMAAALARLTAVGIKADVGATYLRQTIGQLSAPTAKAQMWFARLGLEGARVAQKLGKEGLSAALRMIWKAITDRAGPDGMVLFEKTTTAARTSTEEFLKALANAPAKIATPLGALANVVGGVKSMQAALVLSGEGADEFSEAISFIEGHVKKAGDEVEGFSLAQETLKYKMDAVKGTLQAFGVMMGQVLIPRLKDMADKMLVVSTYLFEHKGLAELLVTALNTLALTFIAFKATMIVGTLAMGAYNAITAIATVETWSLNAAFAACPAFWVGLAIIGLVAAIVFLETKFKVFSKSWNWIWSKIGDPVKDFAAWIKGPFVRWVKDAWQEIKDATASFRDFLGGPVLDKAKEVGEGIKTAFTGIAEFTKELFSGDFWDAVLGGADTISEKVESLYDHFRAGFKKIVKKAGDYAPTAQDIKAFWGWLTKITSTTVEFVTKKLGPGLVNGIKGAVDYLFAHLPNAADRIAKALKTAIGWAFTVNLGIAKAAIKIAYNVGFELGNAFKKLPAFIAAHLPNVYLTFAWLMGWFWRGVAYAVVGAGALIYKLLVGWPLDFVLWFGTGVLSTTGRFRNLVKEWIYNLLSPIRDLLSKGIESLFDFAKVTTWLQILSRIFSKQGREACNKLVEGLLQGIVDVYDFVVDIPGLIMRELVKGNLGGRLFEFGKEAAKNFIAGLKGERPNVKAAANDIKKATEEGMAGLNDSWFTMGDQLGKEYIDGVRNGSGYAGQEMDKERTKFFDRIRPGYEQGGQQTGKSVTDGMGNAFGTEMPKVGSTFSGLGSIFNRFSKSLMGTGGLEAGSSFNNNLNNTLGSNTSRATAIGGNVGRGAVSGTKSGLASDNPGLASSGASIVDRVRAGLGNMWGVGWWSGNSAVSGTKSGARSDPNGLHSSGRSIGSRLADGLGNLWSIGWWNGINLLNGIKSGISNMWDSVVDKSRKMAKAIRDAFGKIWEIRSPSRVMYKQAQYFVAGIRAGLDEGTAPVMASAGNLATAAIEGYGKGTVKAARPLFGPEGSAANQAGRGGAQTVQLEVTGNDAAFVDLVRRLVKVKGSGNVERAFGSRF